MGLQPLPDRPSRRPSLEARRRSGHLPARRRGQGPARQDRLARRTAPRHTPRRDRDRHRLPLRRRAAGQLGLGWATIQGAMPGRLAESASVELAEVNAALDRIAAHRRQGLGRGEAAAAARPAVEAHRGGAAIPRGSHRGRAAPGRARRAGGGGDRPRGRPAGRGSAARPHDGGRPARRGPRGAGRRRDRAVGARRPAVPAGAADAGRQRRGRGRGARRAGRGGAGVQARRRPGPDPPERRRGAGLLPPAQRGDRGRARAGGRGARVPGAGDHPRGRGDRAPARRHSPSLPDHHAPLRPQARRRAGARRAAADPLPLRPPLSRRRLAPGRAAQPPLRAAGRLRSPLACSSRGS